MSTDLDPRLLLQWVSDHVLVVAVGLLGACLVIIYIVRRTRERRAFNRWYREQVRAGQLGRKRR